MLAYWFVFVSTADQAEKKNGPGSWASPSDPVETFIAILAGTFSAKRVGFFLPFSHCDSDEGPICISD